VRGDRRRAAGIGGGESSHDLSLETHVVEFAPRLMPRQLDDAGSRVLVKKIEALGVKVHLNKTTRQVLAKNAGRAGLCRRREPARRDGHRLGGDSPPRRAGRECGLAVGERGGVVVNEQLETSGPANPRHRRGRPAIAE